MALFSGVSFTFTNFTQVIDLNQIHDNFNDVANAITQGQKDIYVGKLGCGVTPTNQLDVSDGTVGTSVKAKVVHADGGTATSHSVLQVQSGGGSGGDASVLHNVGSTTNWSHGIDNSTSTDSFVVSKAATLGTADALHLTTDTVPYCLFRLNESALATASMLTQSISFWLDTTNNVLTFRCKTSGGSMVTGTIAVS